jgi:hypothetical protein
VAVVVLQRQRTCPLQSCIQPRVGTSGCGDGPVGIVVIQVFGRRPHNLNRYVVSVVGR